MGNDTTMSVAPSYPLTDGMSLCSWSGSGIGNVGDGDEGYKYNAEDVTGEWCFTKVGCQEETTVPFICLRSVAAAPPTTTTSQAPPAEINNVVDAWNDMVFFPNASTHGCQCLN